MAGETILVIDADQDINQKMITTLEVESYLIYPVSSQEVNAEMADLLRPSLIYIEPSDLSPAGLEPCKAIHGIPLLIKVPIVILASLEKALGSEYFEEYGIVDFIEPTFGPEELIEKTGTILGKTPPSRYSQKDESAASPRTFRRAEKKRSALLLPAIGIVTLLVIVGAGFMAYRHFMPTREVSPSPKIKAPVRVPSIAPKAELKPQLPPASNVADTSAPASSVPSTPPEQPSSVSSESAPQPPNIADTSPPASSVPSKPPQQPSLVSSESAPQPPHKPFYSVQLGAFRDEDRAQALTKKFREKGYDAFTQPGVMKDNTPIYRVLVNKYEDRKAAKKLAGEIQLKEHIETTLYGE
jgi:cell division septation protein DedD